MQLHNKHCLYISSPQCVPRVINNNDYILNMIHMSCWSSSYNMLNELENAFSKEDFNQENVSSISNIDKCGHGYATKHKTGGEYWDSMKVGMNKDMEVGKACTDTSH